MMKKILDFADNATKYGFYIVLIIFAVACLFSGCLKVGASPVAPEPIREEKTETITAELTCLTEEAEPAFLDLGEFKLTAYCACEKCCGKWADGITSTGTTPTAGRTIAVDIDVIPYGSEVIINGHTYKAEDCGGAIVGNRIDVYFDSHEEALEFGVQYANVFLPLTAENGGAEL